MMRLTKKCKKYMQSFVRLGTEVDKEKEENLEYQITFSSDHQQRYPGHYQHEHDHQ